MLKGILVFAVVFNNNAEETNRLDRFQIRRDAAVWSLEGSHVVTPAHITIRAVAWRLYGDCDEQGAAFGLSSHVCSSCLSGQSPICLRFGHVAIADLRRSILPPPPRRQISRRP